MTQDFGFWHGVVGQSSTSLKSCLNITVGCQLSRIEFKVKGWGKINGWGQGQRSNSKVQVKLPARRCQYEGLSLPSAAKGNYPQFWQLMCYCCNQGAYANNVVDAVDRLLILGTSTNRYLFFLYNRMSFPEVLNLNGLIGDDKIQRSLSNEVEEGTDSPGGGDSTRKPTGGTGPEENNYP